MSGAAKMSSRAGAAARWSIQPGEELASAVLTRGLSKTSTGSRIVSKFPNNRIDNEEIVIQGARRVAGKANRDIDVDLSDSVPGMRESSPSVRVTRDPDAGVLELDPELKAQLREYGTAPVERGGAALRSAHQTIQDAPSTVAGGVRRGVETARDAPQAVAGTARVGVGRVREGVGEARQSVDDAAYDVGYRAGAWTGRSMARGERLLRGVRDGDIDLDDLVSAPDTDPLASAERVGYRAGETTAAGLNRLEDFRNGGTSPRAWLTAARFEAAERGYNTGYWMGERTAAGLNQLDDARAVPRRYATAARFDAAEARENLPSATEAWDAASAELDARRAAMGDLTGQVTQAPQRYAVAARFEAAERFAQTERMLRSGKYWLGDAAETVKDTPAQTRQALADARDLTVRIEPSDASTPRPTTSSDFDLDDFEGISLEDVGIRNLDADDSTRTETNAEADTDDSTSPTEFDEEWTRGSDRGGDTPLARVGVGTDSRARAKFKTKTETESEVAAAVEQSGGFGRLETAGFAQAMEDVQASVMAEAAQEQVPRQQAWEQATERQASQLGAAWESEMEQAADLEGEMALEGELEALFEEEFETETAQEVEYEYEQESEFEYEFEYEYETEGESDPPKAEDFEQVLSSGFGTWGQRYKNPVASADEVMGWDE
jgi:hypothetical protein